MTYLPLKYKLRSDTNAERTLLVRKFELEENDEKLDKVLEVINIPYFVNENNLKHIFASAVEVEFLKQNKKNDFIKNKIAKVYFDSNDDLKRELRLLKHGDENDKIFLYDNDDTLKKEVLDKHCGKTFLSQTFTKYPEDMENIRKEVMEVMTRYNDEILVAQKKKKRRFERQEDGWVKVVRK